MASVITLEFEYIASNTDYGGFVNEDCYVAASLFHVDVEGIKGSGEEPGTLFLYLRVIVK